jgi:predicted transcriptional regulator
MKKKGIWVDDSLFGIGLSPLDKLLYSQIEYLSKSNGYCSKSDKVFACELEVSARSISTSLSFLVEKGLIRKKTIKHEGNCRKLFINRFNENTGDIEVAEVAEEVEFSKSELYNFDSFGLYANEVCDGVNVAYYYKQVSIWENQDGSKPRRKNWKTVVNLFISNDIKNGKIVKQNGKQQNSSNEWSASDTLRETIEMLQSKRR